MDNFGLYIRDLSKIKVLAHKETLTEYKKMKKGDKSARHRLIESCTRLAYGVVNKYYTYVRFKDQLLSEANLALIKAVDDWNPKKGKLTTIVTTYVYNHLNDKIYTMCHNGVYVPGFSIKQLRKNDGEFDNETFKTRMRLNDAVQALGVSSIRKVDDVEAIENEVPDIETLQKLEKAVNTLNNTGKRIIYLKFTLGLDNKQIGQRLNCSKENIRQTLVRRLAELKELMNVN